jgi:hypothetical protein
MTWINPAHLPPTVPAVTRYVLASVLLAVAAIAAFAPGCFSTSPGPGQPSTRPATQPTRAEQLRKPRQALGTLKAAVDVAYLLGEIPPDRYGQVSTAVKAAEASLRVLEQGDGSLTTDDFYGAVTAALLKLAEVKSGDSLGGYPGPADLRL